MKQALTGLLTCAHRFCIACVSVSENMTQCTLPIIGLFFYRIQVKHYLTASTDEKLCDNSKLNQALMWVWWAAGHLEGDFWGHGEAVCDDGFLLRRTPLPAVQLHTAAARQQRLPIHLHRGVTRKLTRWQHTHKPLSKCWEERWLHAETNMHSSNYFAWLVWTELWYFHGVFVLFWTWQNSPHTFNKKTTAVYQLKPAWDNIKVKKEDKFHFWVRCSFKNAVEYVLQQLCTTCSGCVLDWYISRIFTIIAFIIYFLVFEAYNWACGVFSDLFW